MTTRTIGKFLRTLIFGGGVCLLPGLASAEGGPRDEQAQPNVPDHAQAEARGGAETTVPAAERKAPDHARAEARGGAEATVPAAERTGPTDHAAVESRGADTK
jgi:hypothetical protein